VASLNATGFNVHKFNVQPTEWAYLYVTLIVLGTKSVFFLYTELTYCFHIRGGVFTARYELKLETKCRIVFVFTGLKNAKNVHKLDQDPGRYILKYIATEQVD
jgi:hypothetical protein